MGCSGHETPEQSRQPSCRGAAGRRQFASLIGPRKLLGVSTHNLEQVKAARLAGADYVGVGPIFPSTTKPRPELGESLPGLPFARAAATAGILPTVAIAGITVLNVGEAWETGVNAIAVASAVTQSDDPAQTVRDLRRRE